MKNFDRQNLVDLAVKASENSYSPYSNFCVGAALLCDDGEIILGTNVENASYGGAICAERTAFCTAVVKGKKDFCAIAIIGHRRGEEKMDFCAPCGICRQFMSELVDSDFKILLSNGSEIREYTMAEALPLAFDKNLI
jgi:cytidine deaminase